MTRKKAPLLVPFLRADGSLIGNTYFVPGENNPLVEWKENFIFDDTLAYEGYMGGRSAMTMQFRSFSTGVNYPMFFTFFSAMLRGKLPCGAALGEAFHVTALWTFCKRGQNYSVMPLKLED